MNAKPGSVGWIDLTVNGAEQVRDFYKSVIGWTDSSVDMGDYEDYCLHAEDGGDPVVGICHRRGPNGNIPPAWLVYFVVENLEASLERCLDGGGRIVCPLRDMGVGSMAIIKDPAGAICALYETK